MSRNVCSKATVTFFPAKRKSTSWPSVKTVQLNTSNFWEHRPLNNVCQNITIFTGTMRNSTTIDYQLIEIIISITSFLHHITLLTTRAFYLQEVLSLSPGSSTCIQVNFLSIFTTSFLFLRWGACLDFLSAFLRLLLQISQKIIWSGLSVYLRCRMVLLFSGLLSPFLQLPFYWGSHWSMSLDLLQPGISWAILHTPGLSWDIIWAYLQYSWAVH